MPRRWEDRAGAL